MAVEVEEHRCRAVRDSTADCAGVQRQTCHKGLALRSRRGAEGPSATLCRSRLALSVRGNMAGDIENRVGAIVPICWGLP